MTMANLWVEERYIDKDQGASLGGSDPYESMYDITEVNKLYKACMKQFGRVTSKVYIDEDSTTKPIGWVFEKLMRYDGTPTNCPNCNVKLRSDRVHHCLVDYGAYGGRRGWYLQQTWVTLHVAPPTKHSPTYHYFELGRRV